MAERVAGVLLHPTSLPGRFGIGELGPAALAFLDFLQQSGQSLWQVLPLGPTGFGDSPYQCLSAFAGNPLLVSPERLQQDGLLESGDLEGLPALPEESVDFGAVIALKARLLSRAFTVFERQAGGTQRAAFEAFVERQRHWLDDFASFLALKRANGGAAWTDWPSDLAAREPGALAAARRELERERQEVAFEQWLFFTQWASLRDAARQRGVRLMGDVPIFVAHDSADVWAHPELFHLGAEGRPSLQAGVPPDYFSASGQLWGNPLYRWDALARSGFRFWVDRLRAVLELVDVVRLDHFRGFEACWEVPAGAATAAEGRWSPGPGAALFEALSESLGSLPMVAEDLGVITPEVAALRDRFGLPGMAVLQFAFEGEAGANPFLPHNLERHMVAYTGTHDNDTVTGWWESRGESTRSADAIEQERRRALVYLGGDGREVHWDFVRALFVSAADTVVVPLQDLLGLGNEARLNLPGRGRGNWGWRHRAGDLTPALRGRLRELTEVSGRLARPAPKPAGPSEPAAGGSR